MSVSMASQGKPGHTVFKRQSKDPRPVVLSAKRYNSIVFEACQGETQEQLAAVEEEQRYKQYLKDGNDALLKHFKNMNLYMKNEDELQMSRDKALALRVKDQKAKYLLEAQRKERIIRAKQILHLLKPGPRALHQALIESELIHQRKFNQALNEEFAESALQQKRLEEQQCPEILIPFGNNMTEAEVKAQQQAKSLALREICKKDFEEKRQRKMDEKEQEIVDGIIEREQYKCLKDKEDKAVKKLAETKREFCRQAYRDALKEKATRVKYASLCDKIDDRINCVNNVAHRSLNAQFNKQVRERRGKLVLDREKRGMEVYRLQQAKKRQLEEFQSVEDDRYQAEIQIDEERRNCEVRKLAQERRAYELEERKKDEEKNQYNAQIRRFEIATRYKNEEANKRFNASAKRRQDKVTADLRDVLLGQRQKVIERRQNELMRMSSCVEDPYLKDDVEFFEAAANFVKDSQQMGRPLYPLAKAANVYRRQNQLDMVPEGRLLRRNQLRDYCWPGYFSKAQLAYRKYEHREKCRQEQEADRHSIFQNCIKITKMAADEKPYKPCEAEGCIKCFKGSERLDQIAPIGPDTADNSNAKERKSVESIKPISARVSGGQQALKAKPIVCPSKGNLSVSGQPQKRFHKLPDLTRFWTAKPQTKPQLNISFNSNVPRFAVKRSKPQYTWSDCLKHID